MSLDLCIYTNKYPNVKQLGWAINYYQTCKVLPYLQSPQEPHRQDLTFSKPLRPTKHQNSDRLLHFLSTLLTILWYSDSESLSVSGKASPPILFLFQSCSFFSFSQVFLSLSLSLSPFLLSFLQPNCLSAASLSLLLSGFTFASVIANCFLNVARCVYLSTAWRNAGLTMALSSSGSGKLFLHNVLQPFPAQLLKHPSSTVMALETFIGQNAFIPWSTLPWSGLEARNKRKSSDSTKISCAAMFQVCIWLMSHSSNSLWRHEDTPFTMWAHQCLTPVPLNVYIKAITKGSTLVALQQLTCQRLTNTHTGLPQKTSCWRQSICKPMHSHLHS